MFLKLAWRNLWRNRRRTYITMASVFLAVILSSLMMSIKQGSYSTMIESMVGSYTGYVQVHAKGYWDEKNLDNSMSINDSLEQALKSVNGITDYLPRIESFALASSGEQTKGAMVVGVDLEKERLLNQLDERVYDGKYLKPSDNAIMVGKGLAEYLKVEIGDTLVLLGQGYHGVTAAGKYVIKTIVKFGSPDLSKQLVFLPLAEAQKLYDAKGLYTNLIVNIDDPDNAVRIAKGLQKQIGDRYEAMDWFQLVPDLNGMIEADKVEGYVFMVILYTVISFGIFGTVLMMLAERKHEFGVLVAIGMKRLRLARMVWLEVVLVSLLGVIVGFLGSFPICYYFNANPIQFGGEEAAMMEEYGMEAVIKASVDPMIFINQAIIVGIIATILSAYPFFKLMRMDAIKQMRS